MRSVLAFVCDTKPGATLKCDFYWMQETGECNQGRLPHFMKHFQQEKQHYLTSLKGKVRKLRQHPKFHRNYILIKNFKLHHCHYKELLLLSPSSVLMMFGRQESGQRVGQ